MSLSQSEIQDRINKLEADARDHESKAKQYKEKMAGTHCPREASAYEKAAESEFKKAEKCRSDAKLLRDQLKQREENQKERSHAWTATAEVSYAAERKEEARRKAKEDELQKAAQEKQKLHER